MKRSEIPSLEIRQAIETSYRGPINLQGSRVIAKAAAGLRVYDWMDELNSEQNHYRAALLFAREFQWVEQSDFSLVGGVIKNGNYIWITNGVQK